MKKILQGLILGLGLMVVALASAAYYDRIPLSVFTQTGRVTIAATGTSASAVLASTGASAPIATTAVFNNLGTAIAYVALGASNVVATTTGSYPVQPAGTAVLSLGSATYAAAITAGSSVSVSVSTGY